MLSLNEGIYCWRTASALRGRFLIDGDEYFKDIYETLQQAREKILIVGWDWDTHVDLIKGQDQVSANAKFPSQLKAFLERLVEVNPALEIYVLIWKPSPVFFADREHLLSYKMNSQTHPRLHFSLDSHHPPGASHHQKIVVIDDEVAYCGGFDLTKDRWDTRDHKGENPLRRNGHEYEPFHDIQVRVEGPVAKDLGDLVRERWKRATGKIISATHRHRSYQAASETQGRYDFREVEVAIARTEPKYKGYPVCREVEHSLLEQISQAQRYIYIENQYLTARSTVDALKKTLQQEQGPEIIIVLPLTSQGWFEKRTLVATRDMVLRELRAADIYGRLGVYYPFLPDYETGVKVHSKLVISDDECCNIGSANLNNRSMALDTECNLIFDARTNDEFREVIFNLRCDLLAEHSGQPVDKVKKALRSQSMKSWIEHQVPQGRHLRPIPAREMSAVQKTLYDLNAIDREDPWFFDLPPLLKHKSLVCATLGLTLAALLWLLTVGRHGVH